MPTFDNLMTTVLVLAGLASIIITLDKLIDIYKKWKKPSEDVSKKLSNDNTRLDAHERSIEDLRSCSELLCNGVMALLDHEIHNGNTEQMISARDDIMKYLKGKMIN